VVIDLRVNGRRCTLDLPPTRRLIDVLREDLRLTGTKEGCGEGECGACTVLLDGAPVNACLIPVAQAGGHEVRTIEGVAAEGTLADVQRALIDHGGTQCGMCTPGVVLCALAVLEREPDIPRHRLREALAGNLCRCTGYQGILDAVAAVQAARRRP